MEFFKYINKLNDPIVKYYTRKFKEFKEQKLYLVFVSENKLIFSLASKRGNIKHINKIKVKIEKIKRILENVKINRDYSNVIFITLTFNRSKFLNPVYVWHYLSDYVNDYMSNLNKKLKKYNNKIAFFVKIYELHRDYFPHVHILLLLKNPIKTFFWKNKKRIVMKRKLEWDKGFTDVFAPNNYADICNYLTKYITKNYFSNQPNLTMNKSTESIEKNNKPLEEDKSDTLLSILWLFRKFTISHSRLRLDKNNKQINVNPLPTVTFIGLIIIDYSITFLQFIQKNYKIKEIEYFEILKNQKYIIIKNIYVEYNIVINDLLA